MKVFKFGGASVKDAAGVRNLAEVVKHFVLDDLVIIISAMGKTTNALEAIVWAYCDGRDTAELFEHLRREHLVVLAEVAPDDIAASAELVLNFNELRTLLTKAPSGNVDREYDSIVAYGEVWSTLIVSAYLRSIGITNTWVDARTVVRTDEHYRRAGIDWPTSERRASTLLSEVEDKPVRIVTQGFIGFSSEGTTTTLGREGSDFSAAIFAYLLDAESVTIWKDVPGMFNADPNRFPDTKLLEHISYREAIELSYFGASVIHPRTLQPLQKKNIPLYVRSFKDMTAAGSTIDAHGENDSLIPSFIIKSQQLLISITPRDLSFIVEENLSAIFRLFAKHNVQISIMQNSALAFSVAVDDTPRSRALIEALKLEYAVRYNPDCELITVRHYDEATLEKLTVGREILVEQRSRSTARFVVQ